MKELFEKLKECLEQGRDGELVTVVASSGSTPREAGARMLVTQEGQVCGTIGGGAVEYQASLFARELLKTRTSCLKKYTLTKNQAADIGMVCGGDTDVYFQYVSGQDREMYRQCQEILDALNRDQDCWMILDLTQPSQWKMGLYQGGQAQGISLPKEVLTKLGARPAQVQVQGQVYYTEPLAQAGSVYVFGGGHVAQELVKLLAHLEFRCVVMDDRKEFSNPQVFPQAARTITGDMGRIQDYIHLTRRDYVCIMTRGHQFDYQVLSQVLKGEPRYIGVMGSRSKIKLTREKLLADGFSQEAIDRCHMPIGLPIGGETPAEIGVSVAAQLIQVRADQKKGI